MTDKEKLKKIESTCETWKMFRGMGLSYKGLKGDEAFYVIEKAADKILNIIKEKHEENSSKENSSEEKSNKSIKS